MLTEKRHEYILQELKRKGSITVNEIKEELGISESTIRRDLNSLDDLNVTAADDADSSLRTAR